MQAAAALEQAQRDLDHTLLRAPIDGMATQVDNIQLGRFVTAGTPVFAVIDDSAPWVDANPKETDITNLQIGQRATVFVDTFPDYDVLRHRRIGEPRHRRAIRDPAAAERQRQLGQGGAARAAARPARQGSDDEQAPRRHERLSSRSTPASVDARWFSSRDSQAGGRPEMIRLAAGMSPSARRIMLTVCAMTATIMQALDTTVANVALPYMQGSLSASLDQINWVLTSYIVASAIMTAPIGWMSDRYGRKRLFIICCAGFTFASLLCASSQDIGAMVFARLLQGAFGAALVPLSQSVMLDAYPPEQRGQAMAIWGMGVMLGPILGPALGGFLTDQYSWHWVFLINLPVGIVTVLGLMLFMDETKKQTDDALRLVRLHRARHRHRLAATDARPRRAGRLVRLRPRSSSS